jgi:hypothetical protein
MLFAEREKPAHAGRACCRVIDLRIREGDPFGFAGKITEERVVGMGYCRSGFPGEYTSLMLLRDPLLKAVLGV